MQQWLGNYRVLHKDGVLGEMSAFNDTDASPVRLASETSMRLFLDLFLLIVPIDDIWYRFFHARYVDSFKCNIN